MGAAERAPLAESTSVPLTCLLYLSVRELSAEETLLRLQNLVGSAGCESIERV